LDDATTRKGGKGRERAAVIDACSPANQTILKRALEAAHAKLHSYYCNTWPGVCAVALILDPQLRISYLENIGWEPEWVQEGSAAVLEAMGEYEAETENPQFDESNSEDRLERMLMKAHKKARLGQARQEECEFIRYVMSPPVCGRTKALEWWRQHAEVYPCLARVARDHLAIPATSVPAERVFSGGADLISQKRGSLSEDTIRACICLHSWW
jgi:hAT family C-terminal dimerisation region